MIAIKCLWRFTIPLLAFLPLSGQVSSFKATEATPAQEPVWKTFKFELVGKPFEAAYSRRGLELKSAKGGYTARIQWRLQSLFSTPYLEDPRRPSQFVSGIDHVTMRRARYKMEGKAFGGFVTYKYEHSLVSPQLLDLYADVNFKPWLRVRFGQWKSVFSTERYISSGRQQFVDRSIVNREFTLDRQAGVSLFGRFAEGTRGDSMYNIEVLNGTGINSGLGWDATPLVVGRYQWNFLRADPGYSSSDTELRAKPAAYVAFTAARNTSAFTRYSSGGAGQLDSFAAGDAGRYRLRQFNAEFLFKYRGLSLQNENHWKRVRDNGSSRTLTGSYMQAGYFPHAVWASLPEGLEFAYRYAIVDPNRNLSADLRREHTVAVNLFLEGHDNKWTFDVTRHALQKTGGGSAAGYRFRLQYDVHF